MRKLSSLLNDSPSVLVARHAYLPATFLVTFCSTRLLSLFIVLADEFKFNVKPCETNIRENENKLFDLCTARTNFTLRRHVQKYRDSRICTWINYISINTNIREKGNFIFFRTFVIIRKLLKYRYNCKLLIYINVSAFSHRLCNTYWCNKSDLYCYNNDLYIGVCCFIVIMIEDNLQEFYR